MLTDFKSSFTGGLSKKFAAKLFSFAENFLLIPGGKEFLKSVNVCQSYA